MTGSWVPRRVPLKFLLGEFPLFSVRFSLLVLDAHFTELKPDADDLKLRFEELPSSVEGTLVRSQPSKAKLPRLSLLTDSIRYVPAQYQRFYIELEGSFSDYLKKFSSKSRSTLIRKVKKFTEFSGGRLDWREFRESGEMEDFYGHAREVSALTYQERLLKVGLPASEAFRREITSLASRRLARGYILFHSGKSIAYLFCTVRDNGVLLYRYLGYDPQFRDWSPGTVLHYLVFEKLFNQGGFRIFDFTEGEGSQKEFFATGSTHCADIYHFRRRGRILLLLCLHSGTEILSRWIVKVLDQLGLKARVKRFFRSRA